MASGVKVRDDVKQAYQDMKIRHKYKWMMCKISNDEKFIEIDNLETDMGKKYEDFLETIIMLPSRYAVVDVDYEHGGLKKSKLVLVSWCPDTCKIKEKMLFASSKEELKMGLGKGFKEVQACSPDELDFVEVVDKLR